MAGSGTDRLHRRGPERSVGRAASLEGLLAGSVPGHPAHAAVDGDMVAAGYGAVVAHPELTGVRVVADQQSGQPDQGANRCPVRRQRCLGVLGAVDVHAPWRGLGIRLDCDAPDEELIGDIGAGWDDLQDPLHGSVVVPACWIPVEHVRQLPRLDGRIVPSEPQHVVESRCHRARGEARVGAACVFEDSPTERLGAVAAAKRHTVAGGHGTFVVDPDRVGFRIESHQSLRQAHEGAEQLPVGHPYRLTGWVDLIDVRARRIHLQDSERPGIFAARLRVPLVHARKLRRRRIIHRRLRLR